MGYVLGRNFSRSFREAVIRRSSVIQLAETDASGDSAKVPGLRSRLNSFTAEAAPTMRYVLGRNFLPTFREPAIRHSSVIQLVETDASGDSARGLAWEVTPTASRPRPLPQWGYVLGQVVFVHFSVPGTRRRKRLAQQGETEPSNDSKLD